MSEHALAALYRAIVARLKAGGAWGNRVYPTAAKAGTEYPFVVYFLHGGGERNAIRGRDAEIVVVVKVVSDNMGEALQCAYDIDALLNDAGLQDDATDHLEPGGGSEWKILTVTGEEHIQYTEMFANATPVYHAGGRYRIVMEA